MEVRLPKLSASMTEGLIVEWLKRDGDRVSQGEPLYQCETDKAVVEVEAPAGGVLHIMQRKGAKVAVNTVIATID